jgi:hypothetical protein
MNRRGFISLLAGSAGAVLVPWRGVTQPLISIAKPETLIDPGHYLTSNTAWFLKVPNGDFRTDNLRYIHREHFSNQLLAPAEMTERTLEGMLREIQKEMNRTGRPIAIRPTHLIVHPSWTPELVEERLKLL